MSSAFHGFLTKANFIKNTDNDVATFFELSPLALTYSRNRQEHQHSSYPNDTLHTFYNRTEGVEGSVVPPQTLVAEIMAVVNSTYVYFQDNPGTGTVELLTHYINSLYPEDVLSFTAGEVVDSVNFSMTGWVSWVSLKHSNASIRIWVNNTAFEDQYPSHEIIVIQPFAGIDLNKEFFQSQYSRVLTELSKFSITQFSEKVEEARGDIPPTFTRYLEFAFVNKDNQEQSVSTTWCVLVYGQDGDNIDSIKDALVDYIMTDTAYTQAEWEIVFPDIFKRAEFLMYPRWDKISINNTNELASLYSSIINAYEAADFIYANYPAAVIPSGIKEKTEIIPFDYKGVACVTVPGATNNNDRQQLSQLFGDYLPMPTTSPDFARMTINTRNWALGIVGALVIAETATEYTGVASPYRKVFRYGHLFISYHYNNVNYLVHARNTEVTVIDTTTAPEI